ncbi:MAG: MarR family transcriptional regulator [Erysipelotrichaceae bacterium]|nr:MarR family transcriptional regulator [Erysipelotrichaceae bacterium]MBQ1624487.1 MarR family transcriptional regulator [Erysipelotrichaceae bacterium]MBQ2137889.1 MarR family transcriptional regulator [Erysipelotrichaceae bacterium]MBQ3963154.1 MarR family transcriptional regulator [Erysipelotrichaceae bacterium]MBQ3994026.1 MarR family transcriptional regulator [Erysipelotrichaceae bacterium]
MNELLKKENISEFNGAQGTILFVLSNEGEMSIKDIGKATGLAKTSLTSMLERMEKKGLIVKRPSEEDKRSTIVALSEGTESYREVIEKVSLKIGEEYYRGIKPKEAERFEATLKKILDNLK